MTMRQQREGGPHYESLLPCAATAAAALILPALLILTKKMRTTMVGKERISCREREGEREGERRGETERDEVRRMT